MRMALSGVLVAAITVFLLVAGFVVGHFADPSTVTRTATVNHAVVHNHTVTRWRTKIVHVPAATVPPAPAPAPPVDNPPVQLVPLAGCPFGGDAGVELCSAPVNGHCSLPGIMYHGICADDGTGTAGCLGAKGDNYPSCLSTE